MTQQPAPVRPDIIVILTDEERAAPPYESSELAAWRSDVLTGARWFEDHGVSFGRHYTGSLACVPSRPTLFTGQYPDVHGVTQTDGLGKDANDSRMRWLRAGEVPTLGNWFEAAGYDTHYDGKWHISHADLTDPVTGEVIATNDDDGNVDAAAVAQYLDANPLAPYGFSGWVGPEPHGAGLANAGVRRDPLIADRVVAWLEDRYARRAAGDADALRPFLLVASFVNPHDIVLWPAFVRQGLPSGTTDVAVPAVGPAATANEDLSTKPAAQIAFREAYPTAYGPAVAVKRSYEARADKYRELYMRLHAQVDGPLDRVRRAVTDAVAEGGGEAVVVKTSDHGDLLGAHGGLHQKWFNLYDEATRVPFAVARVGAASGPATPARIDDMATSHVDLVPTLLGAAGIDVEVTAEVLRASFSEVHPLPGRNLMPVVDGDAAIDRDRPVYIVTRDNTLEGDSEASGVAQRFDRLKRTPPPLRIRVPAHVAANFEGLVGRPASGGDSLWKIVRTFDDPATWTDPGVRHLAATGPAGRVYRYEPLPDQWELYNLGADPIESANLATSVDHRAVFDEMVDLLASERDRAVPTRNQPWPYAQRTPTGAHEQAAAPVPAQRLRALARRMGLHPDDDQVTDTRVQAAVAGRRALIVATNHGSLGDGRPTGVFASEMTVPYYAFADAGMIVDVASPRGGHIPVDPQSLRPVVRTTDDERFMADAHYQAQCEHSLALSDINPADYDIVFFAGGWGASFDFATSPEVGEFVSAADAAGRIIGGVCHGPLALAGGTTVDGRPLVEGRRISAVTDKQVAELGITSTPYHPETELRKAGAVFESATARRDILANHWVVDGRLVTGQNQNAGPMVAREMMQLLANPEHAVS